jgi:hypothetical protein
MTDIGREDLEWERPGDGKDLEATPAACRPWNERGLKNFAGYQDLAVNETAPASPNPHSPDARQSKTKAECWLTDAAGNGRWNRAGISQCRVRSGVAPSQPGLPAFFKIQVKGETT